MIEVEIPGWGKLSLRHLVLDYNGTLARDGELLAGVAEGIERVSSLLQVRVLTADTFGSAAAVLRDLPCELSILPAERQREAKQRQVKDLGSSGVVAVGNGRNDELMLGEAALGIAVILNEGAAAATVRAADVVCTSIIDAFGLLEHRLRLVATLRG